MARWKARGRLYIRRNWTFFAISYNTVETSWVVIGRSRRFSKVITLSADFRGKGASPTNHCWCQSDCPFLWYQNICSASFSFVTILACDGRTDRQNYDSQDRPRICSRVVMNVYLLAFANLYCTKILVLLRRILTWKMLLHTWRLLSIKVFKQRTI